MPARKDLTAQERKAAQHFIKHGSKIDAYRHAYDCAAAKPATQHRNANEVFNRPLVQQFIMEAQARQAEEFDLEVYEIKQMLATAAAAGLRKKLDKYGNQIPVSIPGTVSALAEINRMNGNHAAVKTEITGKDGGPIEARTFEDFYNEDEVPSGNT